MRAKLGMLGLLLKRGLDEDVEGAVVDGEQGVLCQQFGVAEAVPARVAIDKKRCSGALKARVEGGAAGEVFPAVDEAAAAGGDDGVGEGVFWRGEFVDVVDAV